MPATTTEPRDVSVPADDGTALKGWYWPSPSPRGALIVAHGLGEHSGCYRHVAETLGPALDLDVLAFDFRGHGRSPGRRGVIRGFDDFVADLRGAIGWFDRERPGLTRFVLGHSNGGQVVLRALLEGEDRIAGAVLSSPALRVAAPVNPFLLRAAAILRRVAPGVSLPASLPADRMTRDPENQVDRRDDPLRHGRISAPLYFGMVEGGPLLTSGADAIRTPILMLLGDADPVIDPVASQAFFDCLGSADKTLRVYSGVLHEPLNDLGRERVLDDLAAWLRERLDRDDA